ncbi:MAG TPA: dihydroorotase [Thermoplasmata archaeon]|jgi:dihydroorotase
MLVLEGRVFYRGRLQPLQVGVDGGKIVAVKKILEGGEREDHGDSLILPGCLDMHVHLRDPGLTQKEDFPSGTRSAAIGGVTTLIDMPNTMPPVTTPMALEEKIAAIRGRAAVDYGLYGAPRSEGGVHRLRGATAFKVYMAETTGGLQVDGDELEGILSAASDEDRIVAIHAEDGRLFRQTPATDLVSHASRRPKEAEIKAVETVARVRGDAMVHIAHVTCLEALNAVPKKATKEVTPHHLLLDFKGARKSFGKVNPPLRSPEDREALWNAFANGRIDVVASDHAPHTREEKEDVPFEEAPSGLPGVATSFPLLLRLVKAEKLPLSRLVETTATNPAKILRLEKGAIEVGKDADLVIVDPRKWTVVTARRTRYKCGWTPFEGMEACFPQAVYLRGERIVEDGEPVSEGEGRLVRPPEAV